MVRKEDLSNLALDVDSNLGQSRWRRAGNRHAGGDGLGGMAMLGQKAHARHGRREHPKRAGVIAGQSIRRADPEAVDGLLVVVQWHLLRWCFRDEEAGIE